MIKKRFTVHTFIADYPCGFKDLEDNECEIFCDGERMTYREVTDLLNKNDELKMTNNSLKLLVQNWEALDNEKDEQLDRQNQALIELKKEKERWKSIACNNSSFNSILLHELDIAQEQGYKLSDPFKKLMREKND